MAGEETQESDPPDPEQAKSEGNYFVFTFFDPRRVIFDCFFSIDFTYNEII